MPIITQPVTSFYDNGNIKAELWIPSIEECYFHRLGGPAFTWYYENGDIKCQEWCVNNHHHRLDGPATIWNFDDGTKYRQWWVCGIKLTKSMLYWFNENNIYPPYSDEDAVAITLKWS